MTSTRHRKFLRGRLPAITLLAGVSLWTGCGSDGAGTIHIDSPKARRQMVNTDAGAPPTGSARPNSAHPTNVSATFVDQEPCPEGPLNRAA